MALPTSGQIDLNAIHVEAGGSSGTQCSINDSDIRALIGKGSGVQMAFSEWYGASGVTTTPTLTVGTYSLKGTTWKGYVSGQYGSISNQAFGVSGAYFGYSIYAIDQNNSNVVRLIILHNTGTAKSNSGWTSMRINGITLNRTSASFSADTTSSTWSWSGISLNYLYNNANGTTEVVTFT